MHLIPMFAAVEGASVPEALSAVVTYLWSGITALVTTIVAQPILLIPVGIMVAGAVIGLAKKLMGTGRKKSR